MAFNGYRYPIYSAYINYLAIQRHIYCHHLMAISRGFPWPRRLRLQHKEQPAREPRSLPGPGIHGNVAHFGHAYTGWVPQSSSRSVEKKLLNTMVYVNGGYKDFFCHETWGICQVTMVVSIPRLVKHSTSNNDREKGFEQWVPDVGL